MKIPRDRLRFHVIPFLESGHDSNQQKTTKKIFFRKSKKERIFDTDEVTKVFITNVGI